MDGVIKLVGVDVCKHLPAYKTSQQSLLQNVACVLPLHSLSLQLSKAIRLKGRPTMAHAQAYQENGAIYIHRSQDVLDETSKDVPFRKQCRTRKCFGYVMPAERSHDIDGIEDLHLCEYWMNKPRSSAAASARTGMADCHAGAWSEPPLVSTEDALRRRIEVLEKELAGLRGPGPAS